MTIEEEECRIRPSAYTTSFFGWISDKALAEVFRGCHVEAVCMKNHCCIMEVVRAPPPLALRLRNTQLSQLYWLGSSWISVASNPVAEDLLEGGSHEVKGIVTNKEVVSYTMVFQQPVAWRRP